MATIVNLHVEHTKRLLNVAIEQRKRAAKKYDEMYGSGSAERMFQEITQIEQAIRELKETK